MPKELTPTFTVISKACDGDETAISKILEFYDPYINQCCMRPFYDDNNKLLEITMTDDCTGASWEYDFFDVGALPFNAELGAYKVKDVEYLADYAKTYADGTNTDIDYSTDGDGNILPPETSVSYTITDL